MVSCFVRGCKSSSSKKLKTNQTDCGNVTLKFFRFTKDVSLEKIWRVKCGKDETVSVKNAFVCSRHFTRDQYARNLMHELLMYSPKNSKKLKSDAIPTEHLPGLLTLCDTDDVPKELNSQRKQTASATSSLREELHKLAEMDETALTAELNKARAKIAVLQMENAALRRKLAEMKAEMQWAV